MSYPILSSQCPILSHNILSYPILSYPILFYSILFYPVLFNFILFYCIAFYCIVLYCIVLYCIVLYCIVLYRIVWCCILYCAALYGTWGLIPFASISGCNTSLNCSTDNVTVSIYVIPRTQVKAIDPTIFVAIKATHSSLGSWRRTFILERTHAPVSS